METSSAEMRHFEQALRVDRPSSAPSFAITSSLPATQGQRSKDRETRARMLIAGLVVLKIFLLAIYSAQLVSLLS